MVIIEAVRTQARVAMLSLVQPGLADGAIQAPVVHTAEELDVAALSSPGDLTVLSLRTVAAVGCSPVLTPASVLTWLTLALVDVDLTQLTCRRTAGSGGTHQEQTAQLYQGGRCSLGHRKTSQQHRNQEGVSSGC